MKNLTSTLLRTAAAAGFVLVAGTSAAFAAMTATTVTDLNVRAGPGPQYPTVGLATRGSTAVLDGCIEGSKWCRVDVNGLRGWVYAQYLTTDLGGAAVVVQDRRADLAVPVVTYEAQAGDPPMPAPGDELLGPVEEVDPIAPPDYGAHLYHHQPGRNRLSRRRSRGRRRAAADSRSAPRAGL